MKQQLEKLQSKLTLTKSMWTMLQNALSSRVVVDHRLRAPSQSREVRETEGYLETLAGAR